MIFLFVVLLISYAHNYFFTLLRSPLVDFSTQKLHVQLMQKNCYIYSVCAYIGTCIFRAHHDIFSQKNFPITINFSSTNFENNNNISVTAIISPKTETTYLVQISCTQQKATSWYQATILINADQFWISEFESIKK